MKDRNCPLEIALAICVIVHLLKYLSIILSSILILSNTFIFSPKDIFIIRTTMHIMSMFF